MSDKETVHSLIARLREAKGWTQYRLAKDAGVTPSQVKRIEAGEASRLEFGTVLRLARALGASLSEFDQVEP